jgi:diguanylate cyclase
MRLLLYIWKILHVRTYWQVSFLTGLTTVFTTLVPTAVMHLALGPLRHQVPDLYRIIMLITFFIPFLITSPIAFFLLNMIRLMNLSIQKIDDHVKFDPLTGALTRAYFLNSIERSPSKQGAFLMIDADHFKAVNDTHGHAVGDEVLKSISASIKSTIGNRGIVGRLGGEEFGVHLANLTQEDALFTAWEICENMRNKFIMVGSKSIKVTLSIGMAMQNTTKSFDTTKREADEFLYEAKRDGRDKVITLSNKPKPLALAS